MRTTSKIELLVHVANPALPLLCIFFHLLVGNQRMGYLHEGSDYLPLRNLIICLFFVLKQSPDGDEINCVQSHLQPAFDHPELKGQKPLVMNII